MKHFKQLNEFLNEGLSYDGLKREWDELDQAYSTYRERRTKIEVKRTLYELKQLLDEYKKTKQKSILKKIDDIIKPLRKYL